MHPIRADEIGNNLISIAAQTALRDFSTDFWKAVKSGM